LIEIKTNNQGGLKMKLPKILYLAPLVFSCKWGDNLKASSEDGAGGTDAPFDCERGAPVKNGSVAHYPVEGATCEEAADNLMEPYAGKTECNLSLKYGGTFTPSNPPDTHEKCCTASVTGVTNKTYATVLLPHWEGCDPCFDQFYQNLVTHEQGHVDHCNEAGRTLEDRVKNIPSKTKCAMDYAAACNLAWKEIENGYNNISEEVWTDFNQVCEQYDNDTNHVETQGATLNCNCEH